MGRDSITTKELFSDRSGTLNDSIQHGSSSSKRIDKKANEAFQRISLGDAHLDSVRKNKNIQQLTINKLDYEKIGFVGRDDEISILKNCFKRLTASNESKRRKEMVFIKGYSGTGKTTLTSTLKDKVTSKKNGTFVRGKFESKIEEPYSAISDAFGEICRIAKSKFGLSDVDEESKEDSLLSVIGDELASELGMELERLITLVPELEAIVTTSTFDDKSLSGDNNVDLEAGQEKIKYCFRVLTRVLSTHLSPMVIVLDDLQWVDVSSLEVVDCLITDVQNPNPLMLLGCYRSNEVDAKHILSSKIDEISKIKEKFSFNMTEIELGSLNTEQVNKIAMSMLSVDDDDRTQSLAKVCFKRTLGNPFFVIQFITMLEDERLIDFNLGLLRWIWDVNAIEDSTMATMNVVDLLQARMRKLSKQTQLLLQYSSCLGSNFDVSTLTLLWNKHTISSPADGEDSLPQMLNLLEEGRFIEGCGVDQYRWVHDKVQEAAQSLGDVGKVLFQFEIGATLYHSLSESELEKSLFEVVDLINKGKKKRSPEFAELNLRAAEKAYSIAAFHSACVYIVNGFEYLPADETKWTFYKALTLRLYRLGAEMELALGRTDALDRYVDEVAARDDVTTLEKLPLYAARIHKLNTIDCSYQEASELIQSNLKEMGVDMYRNRFILPFQALSSFLGCVKKIKTMPFEDILAIKITDDVNQRAIMVLLRRLSYTAFISSNKMMYLECSSKMVLMTLEFGINNMAGVAFTTLGLMTVAALGDFKAAAHFAEVGVAMQKKFPGEYSEATAVHVAHAFVFPWTKPMSFGLKPLLKGYLSGMRSGNVERGLWCRSVHDVFLPYMLGKSLSTIAQKCYICTSQSREANQNDQVFMVQMMWQVILNLMGESDDELEIKGTAFDLDAYEGKLPVHTAMFEFAQSELFVFFGKFDRAAELAMERGDSFQKRIPALALNMQETFHRGVALYAMARKTKKRKFKKQALKILKTIKTWMDKGNPNVMHYHLLLSAEQASLDKKYEDAHKHYKNAIISAGRTGNMHHAALFNERYADFLLHLESTVDKEEARYRLEEAIRYYKDWGAEAKAKQLIESLN